MDFLVLRNYEGLPDSISNDIDILVAPRQRQLAEKTLQIAASEAGFRLHNRAEFATLALYFSSESLAEAHFDIFHGLQWRAFDFLDSGRFLEKRIDRGLYSIPHPAHEAATSLLATMIYNGNIKEKYKPSIAAGFKADPLEARGLLAPSYGEQNAAFVVESGIAEQWDRLRASTRRLRRSLITRDLFLRAFKTIPSIVRNGLRIARRWLKPPGLCVVLCGPDGSGKSTVADALVSAMTCSFPPLKGRHFHWKPPVFTGARQKARGPADDPHGKPARNGLISLVYFAVHWFEFFLGSHFRIRPATFKGGLVLIDRYYYDFFIDQRRYRLRVPLWIVRAGLAALKKPDLVLILDAPVEVLQARKQEIGSDETRRQREAYLQMAKNLPNAHIIRADQKVQEVTRDIKAVILQFMAERAQKR